MPHLLHKPHQIFTDTLWGRGGRGERGGGERGGREKGRGEGGEEGGRRGRKGGEGKSEGRGRTEKGKEIMKAGLLNIKDHRTMELVKVLATWYAAHSLNVLHVILLCGG